MPREVKPTASVTQRVPLEAGSYTLVNWPQSVRFQQAHCAAFEQSVQDAPVGAASQTGTELPFRRLPKSWVNVSVQERHC